MKFCYIITLLLSNIAYCGELDEVRSILNQYYVKEISEEELEKSAVKGIISGLDPHSNYIDKNDIDQINDLINDSYVGLGIEIIISNGYPVILTTNQGSPGERHGLQPGDIIIKADGKKLYGLTIKDIQDILQGKIDTNIALTILRGNQEIAFNIIRERIKVISSYVKLIDDIGYIRIKNFSKDVAHNIRNAYRKLDQNKVSGVIVDLRYNPGGLLDEAINVASLFLPNKMNIVSIKGKSNQVTREFLSNGSNIAIGLPIVIIINSGSASAAEIVASAIQDHKRGQVVGTKSFGKGSVQTNFSLKDGSMIKLTTALYYTPHGNAIQGNGVLPDVIVEDEMVIEKIESTGEISESSLNNTLSNDLFGKTKAVAKRQLYKNKVVGDIEKDFQLIRAIDIIRTMNFYKSSPCNLSNFC